MQGRIFRAAALAATLLSACGWLNAAPSERDAVIDEALAAIKAQYVFPERFDAIAQNVRKHQAAGEYAAVPPKRASLRW